MVSSMNAFTIQTRTALRLQGLVAQIFTGKRGATRRSVWWKNPSTNILVEWWKCSRKHDLHSLPVSDWRLRQND